MRDPGEWVWFLISEKQTIINFFRQEAISLSDGLFFNFMLNLLKTFNWTVCWNQFEK